MEINVIHGNILESTADTLVVYLFEGQSEPDGVAGVVDQALGGAIRELAAGGDLKGKAGEVTVLYPRGSVAARRVLVVGLGKAASLNLEGVRRAAAAGLKRARELNAKHVATVVPDLGAAGFSAQAAAQAVVEGAQLALYRFAAPKHSEDPLNEVHILDLVELDNAQIDQVRSGAALAQAVVEGVLLTRDLVNLPANQATPTRLAAAAQEIASQFGMQVTIGDREWAAERKMGAYLGVAKGAGEPPKFIVLEHRNAQEGLPTLVLVGKGITFDTGGISLKPADKMGDMKSDMAGAAAVLGTMRVVGRLDLPLHVVGIAPCTENMPDANAYRPADIITASNGKTIEIISTDAEGRLILADGLVYAAQFQPAAVVDLATLTGACVVALGEGIAAGLFSTDDGLRDRLMASAGNTFERLWPMPLFDEYRKSIDSPVADMKNSGGRAGGVGTSAIFLKEFTSYPWAHLDIAGMALSGKDSAYSPAGATGFGVRLLVDFLRGWVPES